MNLPPSRELDALVAEKVMGFTWTKEKYKLGIGPANNAYRYMCKESNMYYPTHTDNEGLLYLVPPNFDASLAYTNTDFRFLIPAYSSGIYEAFQVVDKLTGSGSRISINRRGAGDWDVHFGDPHGQAYSSESAAHCICLAALSAIGYKP